MKKLQNGNDLVIVDENNNGIVLNTKRKTAERLGNLDADAIGAKFIKSEKSQENYNYGEIIRTYSISINGEQVVFTMCGNDGYDSAAVYVGYHPELESFFGTSGTKEVATIEIKNSKDGYVMFVNNKEVEEDEAYYYLSRLGMENAIAGVYNL